MCGIFGIIVNKESKFKSELIKKSLKKIALLSESRGKDSSGIAFRNEEKKNIDVLKGDIPIKEMVKSDVFASLLTSSINSFERNNNFLAFGHARLVTNGSQLNEVNNQPVMKDDIICIHNGIVTNVDSIWDENPNLNREYQIDTEVIPALIRKELNLGISLKESLETSMLKLEGTYSLACCFADLDVFLLTTNNGSLYYLTDYKNYLIFASEKYFLKQLNNEINFQEIYSETVLKQLNPKNSLFIELDKFKISLQKDFKEDNNISCNKKNFTISKKIIDNNKNREEVVIDPSIYNSKSNEKHLVDLLEDNSSEINNLKRCSKCLLPESFPFIEYDENGVCNYCRNYKIKNQPKPLDELKQILEPYRSKNGQPDCIVPFSGGRDSTYALHFVKEILGLNPIAYTYDWGMVTDLARRNAARVCGKLGVENIIVAADIRWKRTNIKKNIQAWLKYPALGMIPLFMAGDKFFFYYCNQVKKQTGIDLNIWGINDLENTEFKTGFAGLPPKFDKKRIYSLSLTNQFKLFSFVGNNVFKSPGYLNQSVWDNLGSFAARYIAPKKDYYHLFDYYRWDEDEINDLIQNEYQWETAIDTKSTWRIGDGTASFYNYIYYTVAGFSENDTFRSNQIREGMLDRKTALKLVEEDNIARYETLRWYLEIVGLDFETVIKRVNQIPKLY
jgi:glutamine---fructose-6-phosphate transaminase (isomerizing)